MRRWLTVILLSVALAIAYTQRSNIALPLATPGFIAYFRLTDFDRGALNSAFFWTYGLLQIPCGYLVDRFGVKWPLAAAFLLWTIAYGVTGAANTLPFLFAPRLLVGLFEAMITPAGLRWIRDHMEERRRGTATGLFFAGSKWGPAVAAPIATWLIHDYGWRAMFFVMGFGSLTWLLPWLLFAPSDGVSSRQAASEAGRSVPFAALFSTRIMWGTLIGTFCYNYFVFFSLTWLPAYFVERRHFSLNSMGFYVAFSYGGMAAVAILAGLAADWMIERGGDPVRVRRGFIVIGFLIASTVVLGALTNSNNAAVFFSILSMAGLGLATANYWSLPQTVMPAAAAGRVAGAQNMALTVAGILAPLVTAWLKQLSGGYALPMEAIGVILFVGIGAYMILVKNPILATNTHECTQINHLF